MSGTQYRLHRPAAVIAMNNPPVSGLGHALRGGVVAGIERAQGVQATIRKGRG